MQSGWLSSSSADISVRPIGSRRQLPAKVSETVNRNEPVLFPETPERTESYPGYHAKLLIGDHVVSGLRHFDGRLLSIRCFTGSVT
jgi:hypothetical protein